jgi:L-asparaginase
LDVIRCATREGTVIVSCSQCLQANVQQTNYATGSAFSAAGVISGFDMTIEATIAKLLYLFSQNLDVATVKTRLQTNLVGELSES